MGVIVSYFGAPGWITLWAGRATSIILTCLSAAACIAAGRTLHSPPAGLLAGLLYCFLPYAIFHDRQVLADTYMASFGSVALVLTLHQAKTRSAWLSIPTALFIAAAALAKLFGLLYLSLPLLAIVTFFPNKKLERKKFLTRFSLTFALSLFFFFGALAVFSSKLGVDNKELFNEKIGYVGCPPLICSGDLNAQLGTLRYVTLQLVDAITPHFGWLLIALAIAATLVVTHRRDTMQYVTLWTALALLFFVGVAKAIPPRYISFIAVPITTLAAVTIIALQKRFSQGVAVVSLLAITVWNFSNALPMLIQPAKAELPFEDRNFYFTGVYNNTGIDAAAVAVLKREGNFTVAPVIILRDLTYTTAAIYFDRSRIDVRAASEVYAQDIGSWLANRQPIYLIENAAPQINKNRTQKTIVDQLIKETIGTYSSVKGERTIVLSRIRGADAVLRHQIFENVFVRPNSISEHYQSFAASLSANQNLTLLAYPPNQVETLTTLLANKPSVTVEGIGDSWPLDGKATQESLALLTQNKKQPIYLVLLDEAKGDPQKQIELWFNSNLYRLDEQWFGVLRVIRFAPADVAAQTIPLRARFGDGITLESVEILDSVVPHDGLIRLRLNWRANTSITQSFKSFTHILSGEKIVAQHDGQAVGELRPTSTWKVGEEIRDQFAIQLPKETPPGIYHLRIGLYEISTQQRLTMTLGDGSQHEFFVGGEITVR